MGLSTEVVKLGRLNLGDDVDEVGWVGGRCDQGGFRKRDLEMQLDVLVSVTGNECARRDQCQTRAGPAEISRNPPQTHGLRNATEVLVSGADPVAGRRVVM